MVLGSVPALLCGGTVHSTCHRALPAPVLGNNIPTGAFLRRQGGGGAILEVVIIVLYCVPLERIF